MRPFTALADDIVPSINREFIVAALRGDANGSFRIDGRSLDDIRAPLSVDVPRRGACVASLGFARACATVTCELTTPNARTSHAEGAVRVVCAFSSGARRGFARDGADDVETKARARELSSTLERAFKDARAIDLESLCVIPGKAVFVITVNVTVIAHDGNAAGVASAASLGALTTFLRPECVVDVANGRARALSSDERDGVALTIYHHPIAMTYCFFDDVPGARMRDPSLEEELTADAVVVVATNERDDVCAFTKHGSAVSMEDVMKCARANAEVTSAWVGVLKEAKEAFEAREARGKIRAAYDGYADAPDDDYLLDAYEEAMKESDEGERDGGALVDGSDEDDGSDSAEDEISDDERRAAASDEDDDDDEEEEEDEEEDEEDEEDEDVARRARRGEAGTTSPQPAPAKSTTKSAVRSAVSFDGSDDDDIDALFEKAERKNQKSIGAWDAVLPGSGDDLAAAAKPRRKKLKRSA